MRVATRRVIGRVAGSEAQRFAVVRDRAVDILDDQLRLPAPRISAGLAGLKPDGLGEIGDRLSAGPGIGARVAAVPVGQRLLLGAVRLSGNDVRAGAQPRLGIAALAAI